MARKSRHETETRNREIVARRDEGAPALAQAFGLSLPHVYRILAKSGHEVEHASAGTVSPMATAQIVERGRFARSRTGEYAARPDGDTFGNLAKSGLKRFGGSVDDDYDRVFRKGLRARIALYREMGDDPVCHAILHAAKQMIKRVRWYVEPGGKTKADQDAAEFVESCLDDMSRSWSSAIDQATDMIQYGFVPAEIVYKKRKGPDAEVPSKYDDGRIGWRKMQFIAPDSLAPGDEWLFEEEDGGLRGLNQQAPPAYTTTFIPIEKVLLFRASESRDNPEGRSILRAMYKPWYFKTNLEEIEAISAERMGAGFPVIYAGADVGKGSEANSDLNLLKDMARNIRTDEQMSIVLPFAKMGSGATEGKGVLVELVRPEGSAVDFGAIINRYEQRIAMVGLGQFLMLGMSKIGTQALAIEQGDTFVLALDGWLAMICDVLNRFGVERLMRLNHFPGLTGMPVLRCETVGKVDLKAFAEAVNNLVGATVLTPGPELEDYIRKLFDLPDRPTTQPDAAQKTDDGDPTEPADGGDAAPGDGGPNDGGDGKPGDGKGAAPAVDQGDPTDKPADNTGSGKTETAAADGAAGQPVAQGGDTPTRGVMVAFDLPEEAGIQLEINGGVPEHEMHITLCIVNVPDTGSLTEDVRGLVDVVREFAQSYRAMGAMVTGPAAFAPGPDGTPVVALVDAPTLPDFRHDLVAAIEAAGYTIKRNHGYIPHITRFYAPDPVTTLPPTPNIPMLLQTLVVAEDELWITIDLAGAEDYTRAIADFECIGEYRNLPAEHFDQALPEAFARGSGPGRRPAAERGVNAYESDLRQTYQIWADETAANMAEARDDDHRLEILAAALAVLLLNLRAMGRKALPEAATLALTDATQGYTPEMLRLVADTVADNDAYLTNLTASDIPAKMRTALQDPDVQAGIATGVGAAVLSGVLAKFLGRVASYAGAWWGLHNRVVGLDFDEQHPPVPAPSLTGSSGDIGTGETEPDVALFWGLEPGAKHCNSCLEFGNQVYRSYKDLLIRTKGVTPGSGTDCGGNCRCKLGAATKEQIAAYMSAREEGDNTDPFDSAEDPDEYHHGPGPHKGTGTPQIVHGFKYGRSIGNYREMRKKLTDEMWEEYKRRARARIAGGGGGGAPGGSTEPDKPKEPSWEETREAARQAIITRSAALEERVTQLEGDLEAVRQTRHELDAQANQFLNDAQRKPENIGKTMHDWDSDTKAGIEEINARYRDITAKRTAIQEQLKGARHDLMTLEHPELMAETPIQLQPNIKKVGKTMAENQAGLQSFSNLVDASNMPGANGPVPVEVIGDRTSRSYFSPIENRVHMSQKFGDSETMVHEMGHWLETNNPNVLNASIAFRNQRTAGESIVQLRYIPGQPNYRSNEVTLRDKFENPYSGKVYRDRGGNHYATEIVSMGLEYMHRGPARFARNDPGYFNYIYDVMKGRYANGIPASGLPDYTGAATP